MLSCVCVRVCVRLPVLPLPWPRWSQLACGGDVEAVALRELGMQISLSGLAAPQGCRWVTLIWFTLSVCGSTCLFSTHSWTRSCSEELAEAPFITAHSDAWNELSETVVVSAHTGQYLHLNATLLSVRDTKQTDRLQSSFGTKEESEQAFYFWKPYSAYCTTTRGQMVRQHKCTSICKKAPFLSFFVPLSVVRSKLVKINFCPLICQICSGATFLTLKSSKARCLHGPQGFEWFGWRLLSAAHKYSVGL